MHVTRRASLESLSDFRRNGALCVTINPIFNQQLRRFISEINSQPQLPPNVARADNIYFINRVKSNEHNLVRMLVQRCRQTLRGNIMDIRSHGKNTGVLM
jgi:hypothetical protein